MSKDATYQVLFIDDTFGSGYIWALWENNNGNPINEGCFLTRNIMNEINNTVILAGHRWQQFDELNAQRPNEMTI